MCVVLILFLVNLTKIDFQPLFVFFLSATVYSNTIMVIYGVCLVTYVRLSGKFVKPPNQFFNNRNIDI